MRHRKARGKLSRKTSNRKALLRSLAGHLIKHARIETTLDKAKALRPFAEKLITQGKRNTSTARKNVMSMLGSKEQINRLFDELAPLFAARKGGYTRIMRTSVRKGDGASMAIIEFTEKPAVKEKPSIKKSAKKAEPKDQVEKKGHAVPAKKREDDLKVKGKADKEKMHKGFLQGIKTRFKGGD